MHTSGPWNRNIKPASKYTTIFAGRNTHICHLNTVGLSEQEIEANCNLIASAPDLLEALEAMTASYIATYGSEGDDAPLSVKVALAAIAKAKGE